MSYEKDLIVLVADLDAENTITALLDRSTSLHTCIITYDLVRHTERDPGCCRSCVEMLRRYQTTHARALVIFDRHGSGRDSESREDIERSIEDALKGSGWGDRVAVIVLDPELEIWVWSDSPHVCSALGWENRGDLDEFLLQEEWIKEGCVKPSEPKEAMRAALKRSRTAISARIFEKLAENVSLNRCTDPAFGKFKTILQNWFQENG
ncbi:MAG: hypothetical protein H8E73_06375 [Planctomycetes bacterium]|nr:hypothetical protein [Planctomycetota bacterium]